MKAEKGKAIFTAECMHSFHFSCISENVKHGNLLCPICRCKWKEIPFQFAIDVTIVRRIRVLHRVNRSRPLPTGRGRGYVNVHNFGFSSDHDSSALYVISDASKGTFSFIESFVTLGSSHLRTNP
ncbi:hypothetical protein RDI58_004154 [Solanum bulbocastanum]|uniref:Zinc finger C3HC4 RING-type domain-containing protein n=1 Tax=Solanum bulbocastanum TaxID=147425 RepID=A0AAN8YPN9_SOLBU